MFLRLLVIFLFLFLVSTQNPFLTTAGPEYGESISMQIRTEDGSVALVFRFNGLSVTVPPWELLSKIEHSGSCVIDVIARDDPENSFISIATGLSKQEIPNDMQRWSEANKLKEHFERLFNVDLYYAGNMTWGTMVRYEYWARECPVMDEIRTVFKSFCPTLGFGNILTPAFINNFTTMQFTLTKQFWVFSLDMTASLEFQDYFESILGQENTVSFCELTGYTESIQPSPEASQSLLSISISQNYTQYNLIVVETVPSQMGMTQETYRGTKFYYFRETLSDGDVDDLSIRFRMVLRSSMDIVVILGMSAAVIIAVAAIWYIITRKRRARITRLKP